MCIKLIHICNTKTTSLFRFNYSRQTFYKTSTRAIIWPLHIANSLKNNPTINQMENHSYFEWAHVNETPSSSNVNDYILPKNLQPKLDSGTTQVIPIIDMSKDDAELVQEITEACQEFGFFQITNHGISKELCDNVLNVVAQFFEQSHEVKAPLMSTQHMEDGKIFKYYVNNEDNTKKIPMWGEALFHTWHPEDCSFISNLPETPRLYRETIYDYGKQVYFIITRLLKIMSQGLGLDERHIQDLFQENCAYSAQANYYPPCSNTKETLGLRPHVDLKVLTILLQENNVTGLHVQNKGKWIAVEPIDGALVINLADQMQVLSNDRFKSVLHRAVINEKRRVSFAMFYGPNQNVYIEPIKELTEVENNPPKYFKYTFSEYLQKFMQLEGHERFEVKKYFEMKK